MNAETDLKQHENKFLEWVHSLDPNLVGFNPGSTQQVQQLLFAPCYKKESNKNRGKFNLLNSDDEYFDEDLIEEDNENVKSTKSSKTKKSKMVEVLPKTRSFKIDNIEVSLYF